MVSHSQMMQLLFVPDKFHETVEDIEYHPIGNMLPEEEDLLTVMMDDLFFFFFLYEC